jgi:dihydrofolate reductase
MSHTPLISLIAALDETRVIGKDNRLPWRLPADLRHFKTLTLNKPIVMGRKTWESLPGLLPQRTHIVISRDSAYQASACLIADSPSAAIEKAGKVAEIMVVGGASIYRLMLPLAQRMYLTLVHGRFQGDAFFPSWDEREWIEIERQDRLADEKNPVDYSFVTLVRRSSL